MTRRGESVETDSILMPARGYKSWEQLTDEDKISFHWGKNVLELDQMRGYIALWVLKITQLNKVLKMVLFMLPAFYLNKSSWSVLKFETFMYKIYMKVRKGCANSQCISLFKIISITPHKSFAFVYQNTAHLTSWVLGYILSQAALHHLSFKLNLILSVCLLCSMCLIYRLSFSMVIWLFTIKMWDLFYLS